MANIEDIHRIYKEKGDVYYNLEERTISEDIPGDVLIGTAIQFSEPENVEDTAKILSDFLGESLPEIYHGGLWINFVRAKKGCIVILKREK